MEIIYKIAQDDDIKNMSIQLSKSYREAYKGLMSEEYLSTITENYWIPILNESRDNGDICLIAKIDDEIIASSVFIIINKKYEYAELHAIYLSPNYIGKGMGYNLYKRSEIEMRKNGGKLCELEVLSSNQRAIKFYCANGFTKETTFTVEENGMILSCDKMTKKLL